MGLVTGARRPIYTEDVSENRPNSENVNQKLSGNINFLLDRLAVPVNFVFNGFFKAGAYDDGVGGITYIENDAVIVSHFLSLRSSGSGGNSQFNANVYDQNGAFVNTLFGTGVNQPLISGNSGTNIILGKMKLDTVTPVNVNINTAGHSFQLGNLNLGTEANPLLAGYIIVPFIVANSNYAHNLKIALRLKEI